MQRISKNIQSEDSIQDHFYRWKSCPKCSPVDLKHFAKYPVQILWKISCENFMQNILWKCYVKYPVKMLYKISCENVMQNILGKCSAKYPVKMSCKMSCENCENVIKKYSVQNILGNLYAKYLVNVVCKMSCENSGSALAFQIERNVKCCGDLQACLKASISLFWASAIFVNFKA